MDTQKRFGLSKPKAIALFFQMILIALASASTVFILWFSVTHHTGPLFIVSYAVVLISYLAIIFYASYGYRKDDSYFLGAIGAFCAAILLNVLLPFRTPFQLLTLTVLFGLYIAFACRHTERKTANALLFFMLAFAAAFSIYSTFTARTENLNELSSNALSVTAMYLSIWTPVIMTATVGLAHSVRSKRNA